MCALQSHPLSAGHFRVADNRRTSTPPRRQERSTRLCTPGGRSPPRPKQSDGFVGSGGLPHRLGALHRVTTRGTPQSVASFPQVRPRSSETASDRDHEPRSDELRARPDRSRTREGILRYARAKVSLRARRTFRRVRRTSDSRETSQGLWGVAERQDRRLPIPRDDASPRAVPVGEGRGSVPNIRHDTRRDVPGRLPHQRRPCAWRVGNARRLTVVPPRTRVCGAAPADHRVDSAGIAVGEGSVHLDDRTESSALAGQQSLATRWAKNHSKRDDSRHDLGRRGYGFDAFRHCADVDRSTRGGAMEPSPRATAHFDSSCVA